MKNTTKKRSKTILTTSTWLPVFNGFYSTLLGDKLEVDSELEYINEQREEKGLSAVNYDDLKVNYKDAHKELAKNTFNVISDELERLGFVNKSKFESLQSPREYNFTNDSINCEFSFSKTNVENIEKYINENKEAWETYLKEKFTSYSGFMSFYENYSTGNDWSNIPECLSHNTKSGSVLEFILLNEGFDTETVYERVEFYMSEHITNYFELIGE